MKTQLKRVAIAAFALLAIAAGSSAQAQTTIDQNKALAGNVTPGDGAGFPVTLSLPGAYKLTSNLVVPAFTQGIDIQAEGVTLDLNGFTISGPVTCNAKSFPPCTTAPGQGQNQAGIALYGQGSVIRNGTVRGFSGNGIWIDSPGGVVVQDMLVAMNSGHGISIGATGGSLYAAGARITHVVATQNGGAGISNAAPGPVNTRVDIDASVASSNHQAGFVLSSGHGTVSNCVAEDNTSVGLNANIFTLLRGSRFLGNNNGSGEIVGNPSSGGGNLSGVTIF